MKKILFDINPDEDGYPPVSTESVWAKPLDNGGYIIDNIPFFVYGIAPGDEIFVTETDNQLFFKMLVKSINTSVFRASPKHAANAQKIRDDLKLLGCESEYAQQYNLIALEITQDIDIHPVLDYLIIAQESDVLDFEEGVLNHEI